MGEKRYYWIKLKETFFTSSPIKKMRKVAGGDTFVIIYLKMMLLSMNNGGRIAFECDVDNFVTNLAIELDEEEENVNVTLGFLKRYKLLEWCNEQEAFLTDVPCCIGSESSSAERVRKHRGNQKALQCNADVTNNVTQALPACNNVTLDIRDKIKDIEIRDKSTDVVTNVHQEQGQMSQDEKKVAYASHIRMTEENYNLLLELVNGNKVFLKEIIYDCNEWRKDHKPKSKKPNDYLFVKNWLKKELDKVPAAKTVQEEQPVMSADEKRKAYLDSLPPEIRANLDQFK